MLFFLSQEKNALPEMLVQQKGKNHTTYYLPVCSIQSIKLPNSVLYIWNGFTCYTTTPEDLLLTLWIV